MVYRLYSEAQLGSMEAEQLPEIARTNLANVLLMVRPLAVVYMAGLGMPRLPASPWTLNPGPWTLPASPWTSICAKP